MPADLTWDIGVQFTSELCGTTASNPQAHGVCERSHCSLKATLGNPDKCELVGPSAPKEDLQCSAAELEDKSSPGTPEQ